MVKNSSVEIKKKKTGKILNSAQIKLIF